MPPIYYSFFVPALFVWLWSTGFIGAKYGLPYAEPFTLLLIRMLLTLVPLAILAVYSVMAHLREQPHFQLPLPIRKECKENSGRVVLDNFLEQKRAYHTPPVEKQYASDSSCTEFSYVFFTFFRRFGLSE